MKHLIEVSDTELAMVRAGLIALASCYTRRSNEARREKARSQYAELADTVRALRERIDQEGSGYGS